MKIYFAETDANDFVVAVHLSNKYEGEELRVPTKMNVDNTLLELTEKPPAKTNDTEKLKLVNGVVVCIDFADIEQIRTRKLSEINTACEATLAAVKAGYPDSEVLSWSVQETEARAYALDDTKPIPFLTALADARGVTVANLVALIIAKADAFAGISGSLIGKRQKLEKLAELAETIEDIEVVVW